MGVEAPLLPSVYERRRDGVVDDGAGDVVALRSRATGAGRLKNQMEYDRSNGFVSLQTRHGKNGIKGKE